MIDLLTSSPPALSPQHFELEAMVDSDIEEEMASVVFSDPDVRRAYLEHRLRPRYEDLEGGSKSDV